MTFLQTPPDTPNCFSYDFYADNFTAQYCRVTVLNYLGSMGTAGDPDTVNALYELADGFGPLGADVWSLVGYDWSHFRDSTDQAWVAMAEHLYKAIGKQIDPQLQAEKVKALMITWGSIPASNSWAGLGYRIASPLDVKIHSSVVSYYQWGTKPHQHIALIPDVSNLDLIALIKYKAQNGDLK